VPRTTQDARVIGRVVVVTAPTQEPVTLDEVKRHLGLEDTTDHDERLQPLRSAVRQQVEGDTGRALVTQTLDVYFDAAPEGCELWLPSPPLQSVSSVTTYDTANVGTVMSSADYLVDTASEPARIVLNDGKTWPSGLRSANAIVVRIVAGYGSANAVPEALKQAQHLLIGSLSEHREQVIVSQFAGQFLTVPYGYKQLITPYRVWTE
jgi:uncharacterized phiE125 gp8 family phage protein